MKVPSSDICWKKCYFSSHDFWGGGRNRVGRDRLVWNASPLLQCLPPATYFLFKDFWLVALEWRNIDYRHVLLSVMLDPSLSIRIWTGVPEAVAGTGGFSSFSAVIVELDVADRRLGTKVPPTCYNWALMCCEQIHCGQVRCEDSMGPSVPFARTVLPLTCNSSLPCDPRLSSNWSLQRTDSWVKAEFSPSCFFHPKLITDN